ncbi:MAG: hypothetical protein C0404_08815 [Verrucomicrobia bacterium]|nr:hypothetical protein [Verrucomicrobiota bacterium]
MKGWRGVEPRTRRHIVYVTAADPDRSVVASVPGLWLAKNGYRVHFVIPGDPSNATLSTPYVSAPAYHVRLGGMAGLGRFVKTLLRARLRFGSGAVYWITGCVSALAASFALAGMSRKRIIYYNCDFLEPGRHPFFEYFERSFARGAGSVASNEPNRARCMASIYGLSSVPVVLESRLPAEWPFPDYNPVERTRLLSMIGLSDSEDVRLIVAGGGFSRLRCSEELLSALRDLPETYILVFSGMPSHDESSCEGRVMISRLGLTRRVVCLPYLPREDLIRTFAASDIGMLLYRNDGIGNYYQGPGRLTEYIGSGIPYVASDFPGLRTVTLEHSLGALCKAESATDIAAAILLLGQKNSSERMQERQRLRRAFRKELSFDRQASRAEELFRQADKDD